MVDGNGVRLAGVQDFPLISRAQAACRYEMEAVSDEEISAALSAGAIEGYILEAPGRVTFIAVVAEGEGAMLSCFYREDTTLILGPSPCEGEGRRAAMTLRGDARELLTFVSGQLKKRGVTRLFLCLSIKNPNFTRLLDFYRTLDFKMDMVRMGTQI